MSTTETTDPTPETATPKRRGVEPTRSREVVSAYLAGQQQNPPLQQAEIARRFSISRTRVSAILRDAGIARGHDDRAAGARSPSSRRARALLERLEARAGELGLTAETFLDSAVIPARRRGRRRDLPDRGR